MRIANGLTAENKNKVNASGSVVKRALIAGLLLLGTTASAFLLTFALHGPFRLIWSVHSPVNAESIVAVSFILLAIVYAEHSTLQRAFVAKSRLDLGIPGAIALVTGLAFIPTLNAPLLHDSYTHVYEALTESWSAVLATFIPHGGAFLRPLGYVSYYIDARWAGADPMRWHIGNIGLHILNTILVYVLARRLIGGVFASAIAALVFGVHGSRPEAVSWVAARYDLLAGLFVLLTLLVAERYAVTGSRKWLAAAVAAALAGVLSKESSYCLPLLVALLAPFKPREFWRRTFQTATIIALTYVLALIYRLCVLGDIGGYRGSSGHAEVLQFNPIHFAKALLLREWAFLFFPINWSVDSQRLGAFVATLLLILAALLVWSRPNRILLLTGVLWVIAAALPVQHLLLLGADMAGARVLYLPVLGTALFFGLLLAGVRDKMKRTLVTTGLIVSELTALFHNEMIWRNTAFLAQQTCRAAGAEIARATEMIAFRGLPAAHHGVYFLANGFPYCVEMNSGTPAQKVKIIAGDSTGNDCGHVFEWNEQLEKLVRTDCRP